MPPTEVMINCQNKYLSRLIQKDIIPESKPKFSLLDDSNIKALTTKEFFAKPTRSYLSLGGGKHKTIDSAKKIVAKYKEQLLKINDVYLQCLKFSGHSATSLEVRSVTKYIAESLLI